MKILIVDDEQAILKMYSLGLIAEGLEVLTAPDGSKALEIIKQEKPDAVLLDIIMPKFNGLDILKTIKETEEIKNTPVFLLTNLPKESSADKAKELGGAGYFVKAEIEPRELAEMLKRDLIKKL